MRLGITALLVLTACPGSQPGPEDSPDATPQDAAIEPFAPPLGGTWEPDGAAVVFRVAAPRATHVEVWIYDAPFGPASHHVALTPEDDPEIWSARVLAADLPAVVYYGYRAWGPSWTYDPAWQPGSELGFVARVTGDGDRMNPNKLLIDPYARELSHDPTTLDHGDATAYRTDDASRAIDSGPVASKSIVLPLGDYGDPGAHPGRAMADQVIDEIHLRGLTAGDPTAACPGTYAAAGARAAWLAELGVTAVELMPVHETWNDRNDVDPASASGDNYWGYQTLAFFAPDRRYACDRSPGGPTREWRAMVRAFHDAGLEVWIDVVYNHTAEGGGGSLLSLRGLDNATYYELDAAGTGFADQTGIGASTNAVSPRFRDLVIDSLTYWSRDLGVDGFRFDLAPVLGNDCARGCFHFAPDAPGNILQRAVDELPGIKLIAEPWGIGAGTYQVGHFPDGWSEWNDQFRDLVRQDVNLVGTAEVTLGGLADRLAGSPGIFGDRGPTASINYVDSHDGLTLRDLSACNGKNNEQAWPLGPSSGGTDANYAWDYAGDAARQRQAARTSLALTVLAAGVPMFVMGDEVLRGQACNNNPYNLDSPAIWMDWSLVDEHAAFLTFTRRLLALRAAHPALRSSTYPAITWLGTDGLPLPAAFFSDPGAHFLGWRIGDLYVAYDGAPVDLRVTLPPPPSGTAWVRVADTAAWMEPESNFAPDEDGHVMAGNHYDLAARSLAIFVAR